MGSRSDISFVEGIMGDYARLTGLEPVSKEPRRYLWTDAFAVCNYLGLYQRTRDQRYRDLALRLVDQVHHVLGRHRSDDVRKGWISGLDGEEGEKHPTIGGLRIGKPMNERRPGEPFDPQLEWEQDGQYYHYLTKWMHALAQVARATGDPAYLRWALELAKAAHAAFTYVPPASGSKRMHWKMSIDLTHPLVPSMGQHDPLDGYVTYCELQTTADQGLGGPEGPDLNGEIADMASLCRGGDWTTDDPLGIGGLLTDAARVAQLMTKGRPGQRHLMYGLVGSAMGSLSLIAESDFLGYPAEHRLAFRELGLSIGLRGVELLHGWVKDEPERFGNGQELLGQIEALRVYVPLGGEIERFWTDDRNRTARSWNEHREINLVMLATSLEPEGFLLMDGRRQSGTVRIRTTFGGDENLNHDGPPNASTSIGKVAR